ncbi:MAG: alpha/beta hydrolase [Deltaproteobacteria bacterium]|nr:alpha/beta hydrolase [Deltaproteobacteria bacterium]
MHKPSGLILNAAWFDPRAVSAETQAFNERFERALTNIPTILDVPPQVVRQARESGASFFGPIIRSPKGAERFINGPVGQIPLRIFATPNARGVLLHIHGGGWTFGAHDHQDPFLEKLAERTGLAVVSVGYRLLPEHPYPAASDDCEAAALWLIANARQEFGSDRLFIGGESAGAHLSAVTLLRLRDKHGVTSFHGAMLTYGTYDLTMTPSARRWGKRNLILSTPIINQYYDWYAPNSLRGEPDVSPLYADLVGLPPALFTVGTLDPLLDDTLFMASRWCASAGHAELAVYPGGIHAFNSFPIDIARSANAKIRSFLNERIEATS